MLDDSHVADIHTRSCGPHRFNTLWV